MPQISKIRIVNFKYNNGKRLIADELYNFENEKGNALDVLINLENGGGKSVLVQLMMQPIIPKAKVANRKIESFFTKSTDHCYILLEWILDNSKKHLMTGIAMSASDTIDDNDEERGFHVKYYNFISSYQGYSKYDITSLELSKKDNNKFIPESFDYVRNLTKKAGNELERFGSDDKKKWKDKLAEYGIFQDEWKLIEELNSNEDGLSRYFSELKTSDAVINKLIIPRIENKQSVLSSKEDSSLSNMIISYAKQYSKHKDVIRERDTSEKFNKQLKSLEKYSQQLWTCKDNFDGAVKDLFGFYDGITYKIKEQNEKCSQNEYNRDKLNKDIFHIQYEMVSNDYYLCKENLDILECEFTKIESSKNELLQNLHDKQTDLKAIECAYYNEKIIEIDNKIKAIKIDIENRENNSDSKQQIAVLKYSAYISIQKERANITKKIKDTNEENNTLNGNSQKLEKEYISLQAENNKLNEIKIQINTRLNDTKSRNDKSIKKLGFEGFRTLDDKYNEEDLIDFNNDLKKNLDAFESELQSVKEKIESNERIKEELPQQIADCNSHIRELENISKQNQEKLNEYYALKESVQSVCNEYRLDFDVDNLKNYIKERISVTKANILEISRKIETTNEKIFATKRGMLHIPKLTTEFLNASAIEYIPFEKYILKQKNDGILSQEKMQEILDKYPYLAYSIIVEESNLENLYQESKNYWLPSVLPVFTYQQLDTLIKCDLDTFPSISSYAKDYFIDDSSYADKLEKELSLQKEQKNQLDIRLDKLNKNHSIIENFEKYDLNFENELLKKQKEISNDILNENGKLSALKNELTTLTLSIKSLKEDEKELTKQCYDIKTKIFQFDNLRTELDKENTLQNELHDTESKLSQIGKQLEDKKKERESLQEKLDNVSAKLKSFYEQNNELSNALEKVSNAIKTDIIEEDWKTLLQKYNELSKAQNSDIERLKDDLTDFLKNKADYQEKIDEYGIEKSRYEQLIYSKERKINLEEQISKLKEEFENTSKKYYDINKEKIKAESNLEHSKKDLSFYGNEPLPKNEVGMAFEERINTIKENIRTLQENFKKLKCILNRLEKIKIKVETEIENYTRPTEYKSISINDNFEKTFPQLKHNVSNNKQALNDTKNYVKNVIEKMYEDFKDKSLHIISAITNMKELLKNNDDNGDRYYTLFEHINGYIHSTELKISQINTDLKDMDKTKDDIVNQCVIQGRQMYEGLKQLSEKSKVSVQGKRKQILVFDIPEQVNEEVSIAKIKSEIEKGTSEIVKIMVENNFSQSAVTKIAEETVGSKNLLRKYIGMENITLKAYKIDRNPSNSGYRRWEQTQINNSGAEKFVVYFAIILSLIAYTRDEFETFNSKNTKSVLILDNPFGPISSKHVLEPMFEISKNYNVQMICLSNISNSDVLTCFNLVIRAIIKKITFGNKEQLTHDGNDKIEHGFYRAEQLKLI